MGFGAITLLLQFLPTRNMRNANVGATEQIGVSGNVDEGPIFDAIVSFVEFLPLVAANTVAVRLFQYKAAIEIATANPLFGLGGWNFYLVSTKYGLEKPFYIHNTYFEYLAGSGFPGFSLFVGAVGVAIWFAYRCKSETPHTLLHIGLLLGIISVHLLAALSPLHNTPTIYAATWFFTGALLWRPRQLR
jgi:O-antigen ligase